MAITTITGHVSRAIDFYNKELFFAIAKNTPWANEENPTAATPETLLDGVIGYKQVSIKNLVIQDNEGDIVYRSQNWRPVTYQEALEVGAKYVYLSAYIEWNELPLLTYRQIGVYSGLIREPSVQSGKTNLLPNEVADPGILEIIDNRKPTYRELDKREIINLIVEF